MVVEEYGPSDTQSCIVNLIVDLLVEAQDKSPKTTF
jgi:hypothetical protein